MKVIALIGAGQLGSRHLQGLKKATNDLMIYVVDSSRESLKIAQERYEQISNNQFTKKVVFVTEMNSLPSAIDLAIIATGSMPRASITKQLLSHSVVDYIIFEKVLFPRLFEYDEITRLLKEKGVKAWVNCPRRMWSFYQKLFDFLEPPISMTMIKKNWGLCCNSIHFIDIFMLLARSDDYNIELKNMQFVECKRLGYIEMIGEILIKTPNGSELVLKSIVDDVVGNIVIKDCKHCVYIVEEQNMISIDGVNYEVTIPFQSALTNLQVDDIIKTGTCPLSSFNVSVNYHKPFINAILNEYNRLIGCKGDLCPIT